MTVKETALIILAAGRSVRFGSVDKLTADLNGEPLVRHIIRTTDTLPFVERFVVLPSEAPERAGLFPESHFTHVINPSPEDGQGGSVALGVRAVTKSGHERALLVLGDMPNVPADHLFALTQSEASVCATRVNGVMMPPVMFQGEALERLLHLPANARGKSLFQADDMACIDLGSEQAFDIDTQADWHAARKGR